MTADQWHAASGARGSKTWWVRRGPAEAARDKRGRLRTFATRVAAERAAAALNATFRMAEHEAHEARAERWER